MLFAPGVRSGSALPATTPEYERLDRGAAEQADAVGIARVRTTDRCSHHSASQASELPPVDARRGRS